MFRKSALCRGARRARLLLLASLCMLLAAAPAFARPSRKELSKARAKFQQATELEHGGNWGAALTAFREVGQVRMTPQVRFHIALCAEHLGQLAAALGGYKLALEDADEVRAKSFKTTVDNHIKDLQARIPKVNIQRGKGAEAARIELDGVSLGTSSIGVDVPVDPGPHTVSAKAPGHEPFSKTVSVKEKQTETVEVVLEETAAPTTAPPPSSGNVGKDTHPVEAKPHSKVVPFVIGGVGIASLGAAGAFYLLRNKAISDLDAACGPNRDNCPASSQSTYDNAKRYNLFSQIALGVGVAAVGTATVLLLTGHSKKAKKADHAGLRLEPAAPGTEAGASLVGRF